MAETLKLGNGEWATKENSLLSYNDENGNYKPLPFDFTRASSATVVNKAGLIETVQSGIPRIDFLGNTNGALLLEPQRTNFALWSEDLSQSDWVKTGLTVNVNQITSPDGGLNADEVDITTANAHYLFDTISVSASTNYTFTFYVKKGTATDVSYSILNATNFTNIVNTTSYFNEISDTDWTRISVEFTTPSGCTSIRTYPLRDGSSTGTIYIWGAQLEQASYPTSYIPTQGSSVTRVADACSQTVPDGVIGQTEGSVYVEVNISNTTSKTILALDTGSANNFIILNTSSSLSPKILVRQSNGSFPAIITGTTMSYGVNKIAFCYKSGDYAMYVNGVLSGTSTSTTFPSGIIRGISVGANSSYGYLSDTVNDVKLYNTRLSNSELATLTTL